MGELQNTWSLQRHDQDLRTEDRCVGVPADTGAHGILCHDRLRERRGGSKTGRSHGVVTQPDQGVRECRRRRTRSGLRGVVPAEAEHGPQRRREAPHGLRMAPCALEARDLPEELLLALAVQEGDRSETGRPDRRGLVLGHDLVKPAGPARLSQVPLATSATARFHGPLLFQLRGCPVRSDPAL